MQKGLIATVTIDSNTYVASPAHGDPMVLVDADGLAVLSLAVTGAFVTLRPDGGFQGVFLKEGDFGFKLTSHTTFKLNFGILRDKTPVNEISVIRPGETLTIKGDWSAKNKQFRIEPLEGKIQLKDDEKDGVKNAKGTYFNVCVYPETGNDLSKGKWTCPDVVVTKRFRRRKPVSREEFTFGGTHKARSSGYSFGGNSEPIFGFSAAFSTEPKSNGFCFGGNSFEIKDTLASKITHGERVKVNSARDTGEYDYAKGLPMTLLGLSILGDAALAPPVSYLVTIALAEIARIHTKQPDVVYEADECVICLEGKPDTVLAKCGPACGHAECVE